MQNIKILQNIRMSNLVIPKWRLFEYKLKFEKLPLLFRSEIDLFEIFFKRLYKESFEDLQINSHWKFQTRATMSDQMAAI